MFGSFRSSIEGFLGEIGTIFEKFNNRRSIRSSDYTTFNLQFKLACLLLNVKKCVDLGVITPSSPRASAWWSKTMRSTIMGCWLSFGHSRSGGISWKGLSSSLKYGWTIKILSIFGPRRNSAKGRHGGPSTCLGSTSHFTIDRARVWAKQMRSQGGQTTGRVRETMRI